MRTKLVGDVGDIGEGDGVGAGVGAIVVGAGGPAEDLQINLALGSERQPVVAELKSTSMVPSPLSQRKHPQGTKFSHSNTFSQLARS